MTSPIEATIDLRPDAPIGEVHDHLYGANIEHLGQTIYGGSWAEMLRDRKFAGADLMYRGLSEGLSHQHPYFGVVIPWEPVNPDYHDVLFVHDNSTFYTGRQSQRITVRRDDGRPRGIRQAGLYLAAGQGYQLRLVLKGEGQPVAVRLGDASWTIAAAPAAWTTFERTLTPTTAEATGALELTFRGGGSVWVGCASLMPDTHVGGHRADVVEAIGEWRPTFLRWPGGNFVSAYPWQSGIGDRDRRPSYLDPAWSLWEPNDVGTDEFIELCRLIDSEPILTVNMGTGSAAEAAAWVEYCNGAASTEQGALRAENGHPEPYGVTTWFVGNEQFGNWQVGHVDAETYARSYVEFARAMRAVDPGLKLIGVGVPSDLYGHWNELVLNRAGAEMDGFSLHYYSIRTEKWDNPPSPEELVVPKIASAHEVELMLDETLAIVARHAQPPIPIAFDEWNTYVGATAPAYIEPYNVADALYAGALMNACISRCDRIGMTAIYNLVNVMGNYLVTPFYSWSKLQPTRGDYWVASVEEPVIPPMVLKAPTTLVMELLTHHRGPLGIHCEVETPSFSSPESGNLPAFDSVPTVHGAATYDADTRTVFLSIVNRDLERAALLGITGLERRAEAKLFTVSGDGPLARNTPESPAAVAIQESSWPLGADTVEVPAHSFTMLVIPTEKS